jgi:hypothetical protein
MMKSKSLEITGQQPQEQKEENQIGQQLGEIGSGGNQNLIQTPQEVQRDLQTLLPQSVQQSLCSQVNRDYEVTKYIMTQEVPERDYQKAVALLEASLEPLPPDLIKLELTRMKVKTAARNMTTEEITLQFTIYMDELRLFPADVVVHVLQNWPDRSKWWPTWYDLNDELRFWSAKRELMLEALLRGPKEIPSNITGILAKTLKRI